MRILIAGDYCPRYRGSEIIEKKDFALAFDEVKDLVKTVDYSIVNFECPIVTRDAKPIFKQGPNLRCTLDGADAINYIGFDCVTLANNHFLDYGSDGVVQTLQVLGSKGIDHVGGGVNLQDASQTLYKEIDGKKLAIISCCEQEFSIATNSHAGSNPLNPIQQYYAIQSAKRQADFVVVIVHGGHEHFQLPSPRMVETYRFFIDAGADAVVNHHQHCFSGYEVYHNKPIFYGLGNFFFDNKEKHSGIWTEGYMVTIEFGDENLIFYIHPYRQCADVPRIEMLAQDCYNDRLEEINAIIANPDALQDKIDSYYAAGVNEYCGILEPIRNRFYLAAKSRGWLPSLISKKRKTEAQNYICCEAYHDKLKWWLTK